MAKVWIPAFVKADGTRVQGYWRGASTPSLNKSAGFNVGASRKEQKKYSSLGRLMGGNEKQYETAGRKVTDSYLKSKSVRPRIDRGVSVRTTLYGRVKRK